MAKRLTPALLWTGFALNYAWTLGVRAEVFQHVPGEPWPLLLRPFSFGFGLIVANVLTARYARKIQADYPQSSRLRSAWGLVFWSAILSVVRYAALFIAVYLGQLRASRPPAPVVAGQFLGELSVVLLLAGLVRMRTSLAKRGFGRLRTPDKIGLLSIGLATVALLVLRSGTPQNRFPLLVALQKLDPILVGVGAIVAVLLNRVRRDMDGGFLDSSLAYVVALSAVRFASVAAGRARCSMLPALLPTGC